MMVSVHLPLPTLETEIISSTSDGVRVFISLVEVFIQRLVHITSGKGVKLQ